MNKYIFIITPLILLGCANPVVPTGGPKDIEPPKLLHTNIPNRSTNVKPERIEFVFDENIQVNNINEEIVISPVYRGKFNTSIIKKRLILQIDSTYLNTPSTYSISFNNAISDLNEGNKYISKPYLFSTGMHLDTQNITATYNLLNGASPKKLKAFAYNTTNNFTIYKGGVRNNMISFSGLDSTIKKVVIFDDINGNDTADQQEPRGFNYASTMDTATINLYPNQLISLQIGQTTQNKIKINGFTKSYLQLVIEPILSQQDYTFSDTLYIDSSTFKKIKQLPISKLYLIPTKPDASYIYGRNRFNISSFSLDSFINLSYESDSALNSVLFYDSDNNNLPSTKTAINRYKLRLESNENITIKTSNSDSISIQNKILRPTSFSNENGYPIHLEVKNNTNGQTFTSQVDPQETKILYLLTGDYSLTYWHDKNNDYHITPPDTQFLEPGEDIHIIKNFKINGNIDFHMKLTFNE